MSDHFYSVTEIVGSADGSIDEAIRNGIAAAAKTLQNLEWFEVTKIRGHLDNGKIAYEARPALRGEIDLIWQRELLSGSRADG